MATLLLLRHGRTTANADGGLAGHRPVELDDDRPGPGRPRSASGCAALPLAAVVTSPLIRCRQTARAGAARGVRRPSRTGSIECGYGDWEGQPLKKLAKDPLWPVVQQHPSAVVFPGGEAMAAMAARAVAAVRALGRPGHRRARAGGGLAGVQPRRRDQGDRRRRARHAPGPVPADRGRPGSVTAIRYTADAAVPAPAQRHRRRPGGARAAGSGGAAPSRGGRVRRGGGRRRGAAR